MSSPQRHGENGDYTEKNKRQGFLRVAAVLFAAVR
jgi:hypothetical protein